MANSMEDNAELEFFRRQWREEVAHRGVHEKNHDQANSSAPFTAPLVPPTKHEVADRPEQEEEDEIEEEEESTFTDHHEIVQRVGDLSLGADEDTFRLQKTRKEPSSALEHFERAVEKEAEGSLGDSLQYYRKAYRLDASVDKTYRNKHFAAAWKKPTHPIANPTANATTNSSSIAQPSQDEPVTIPTPELIASFANLPIPQAKPVIANTPPPPCPIANVPSDIIVEILRHVAMMDPALCGRVALVCKRLAFHFSHEQHIWKRVCQDSEFGFKRMHYAFACDILGRPEYTLGPRYALFPRDAPAKIPKPLTSWSHVFQTFPRLRFTGIYLSTVNYTRAGAASSYQSVSWNSPIHIVTYYRYMRFYPDGSVITLLHTTAPAEIVPHFSKENVATARAPSQKHHHRQPSDAVPTVTGASDPVPQATMAALKYAHRGRWHLTKPPIASDESTFDLSSFMGKAAASTGPDPRDVVIETEGSDSKYVFTLHLSLRSSPAASRSTKSNPTRNTKLAWKGYWGYNKRLDEWLEFRLRNEGGFVFRRVRGWGLN